MNNKYFLLLSSTCVFLLASTSVVNAGIVTDNSGKYVTDGKGECVSYGEMKHYHEKHAGTYFCGEKPKKVVKKASPPPKPARTPKPIKQNITIEASVLFDFDSDTLKPEGKQYIEDIRQKYKFYDADSVDIVGHTDSSGPDAYNQNLSERRASSVKKYLVETGSAAAKITTSGKGESQPANDNSTREGRKKNRRVEITVEATEQ